MKINRHYLNLAENYLFSKEYFKAIACLEKALRLAETDETKRIINYNLAVVYFHIENLGLAKMYVEKAEQFTYKNCINGGQIYVNLVSTFYKLGF